MGRQFEFFSYFSHQVEQEEKLYIFDIQYKIIKLFIIVYSKKES